MSVLKPSRRPRGTERRVGLGLCGVVLACMFSSLSGCSSKPNPLASNVSYGPDDRFATRILNRAERQQVIEIMQESVEGPTDQPARPARYGVRWSDIPLAANMATKTLEMAVLSIDDEEDGELKRIKIVSIGEMPAELLVRRMPPPTIYQATATVGLFDDQTELANRLVKEFGSAMRAFGAKPGWPPLPDE